MINIIDKIKCSGCSACFNVCPVKAIQMKEDVEGFLYPFIDNEKCISCNLCSSVCPYNNRVEVKTDLKRCFVAYNNNSKERQMSSSGGMFILFAKYILSIGGIVFGASYYDGFLVHHTSAQTMSELYPLIGSKYLQSRIDDSYVLVKKNLEEGRSVLFVGTSCQIEGLKSFLRKEYKKLFCIDLICLGVPSPRVWKDYLHTFFGKEDIKEINFKHKKRGWHDFSLFIKTNKRTFCKLGKKTLFFSGYFKSLYSRPSCSNCIFKGCNRNSDITISDCWGYNHIAPELDDNKGLSSIVCHSKNGLLLFDAIKKDVIWKETSISYIEKYNKNYYYSMHFSKDRDSFWRDYETLNKKKVFRKYCKAKTNYSLIEFLYSIKKKIIK